MGKKKTGLSWSEKISYGMGDCGANVTVALCSTFLTAYYTDTVGIAAAAVGTMMLLARVFDGVTDIVMGAIVDKTKTRWGKARPWVLCTAPLMAILSWGRLSIKRRPAGARQAMGAVDSAAYGDRSDPGI